MGPPGGRGQRGACGPGGSSWEPSRPRGGVCGAGGGQWGGLGSTWVGQLLPLPAGGAKGLPSIPCCLRVSERRTKFE